MAKCINPSCNKVIDPNRCLPIYKGGTVPVGHACSKHCARLSKSTPGTTPPDAGVDRTQGTFSNLKYGGQS